MSRAILIAFLLFAPAAAQDQSLSPDRPKGVPGAGEFGDAEWKAEFQIPGDTKGQAYLSEISAADQADLIPYYRRLVRGALSNLGLCPEDGDCPALLQVRLLEQTGSSDYMLQYRVDIRTAKSEMFERVAGGEEHVYIRVKNAWKDLGPLADMKTAADRLTVQALARASYGLVRRDEYRIRK